MFFMLFFWILVIICLSYLLKRLVPSILNGKQASRINSAAFDIRSERYARGEIGQAEFVARKKDITG
ncbi:MAG: SHOCT domain-containing protein [Thermodesulfobacteriota bacterium]